MRKSCVITIAGPPSASDDYATCEPAEPGLNDPAEWHYGCPPDYLSSLGNELGSSENIANVVIN